MKTKHIAGAGLGLLTLAGHAGHAGAEIVGYEKYTYDASGNIVEKQIDDQVTRFDYKGNILKSNDRETDYLYDRAGRLIAEVRDGRRERELDYQYGDKVTCVEQGATTTVLFYNAEGHLVGKHGRGGSEAFAWDGIGLALRAEHVFVNEDHIAGGVPVLADGQTYVSDYLGSTLDAGGNAHESTAYGEGLEDAFFTGKPFVEELRSFVFPNRNFSPTEQRWTTVDPIGFPDGPNLYLYVNCDPVTRVDPLGLATESEVARENITVNGKSITVVRSYTFDKDTEPDWSGSAAFSGVEFDPENDPIHWEWKSPSMEWTNTSNWDVTLTNPEGPVGERKFQWFGGEGKAEGTLHEGAGSYPSADIPGMGMFTKDTDQYEY